MESIIFFSLVCSGIFCIWYGIEKTSNKLALIFVLLALIYGSLCSSEIKEQFIGVSHHKFKPIISKGFE